MEQLLAKNDKAYWPISQRAIKTQSTIELMKQDSDFPASPSTLSKRSSLAATSFRKLILSLLLLVLTYIWCRNSSRFSILSRQWKFFPESEPWHKYVRAPSEKTVQPNRIVSVSGNVSDPSILVTSSSATLSPYWKPVILRRSKHSAEVPSLIIDFGQNVVGQLIIDFAGAESYDNERRAGLRLAFSETLQYLTDRSDFTRSDNGQGDSKIVPSGTDQIAVKSGPYTWTNEWGCEYDDKVCSDGLHGFRYVKVSLDALLEDSPYTSKYGQIKISSVKLQWSGYLGTPKTFAGWFECSDKDLTQWWYDASYTNEMCIDTFRSNDTEPRNAFSNTLVNKTVLHDGAKRDRDPYTGDVAVAGITTYLTHDIAEAARNVLEDLALHQRSDGWIPPASINDYTLPLFDYPLWWVISSQQYVLYTGDVQYIERHYSTLLSVLNKYYPAHTDPTTSLLTRPPGHGDYAFTPRDGTASYYSVLYILALRAGASLANLLLNPSDANNWLTRATQTSQSFHIHFWDTSVSAYLDRNCTSHASCDAHPQDANALSILAQTSPDSTPFILSYLSARALPHGNPFYDAAGDSLSPAYSTRVYAFISTFEVAARFRSGHAPSALDQLRRTYGWMASHDPFSSFWEGVGRDGTPHEAGFTSMAHGWSTGIVGLLTNYVLGVEPVEPGFVVWTVYTRVGWEEVQWARGVVPTKFGGLGVSWVWKRSGTTWEVRLDVPPGTSGLVVVPGVEEGRAACVVSDGTVVWGRGMVGDAGVVEVDEHGAMAVRVAGAGKHVVSVRWK